jgi:hypothetical protein
VVLLIPSEAGESGGKTWKLSGLAVRTRRTLALKAIQSGQ